MKLTKKLSLAATVICLGLSTACVTPGQESSVQYREILEMRRALDAQQKTQAESQRRTVSQLDTIRDKQEADQVVLKELLGDVLRHIRNQDQELEQMKATLDEQNFALQRLTGRSGLNPTFGNTTTNGTTSNGGASDNGEAAIGNQAPEQPPAGSAVDQAIARAQNEYNLGNYAEALANFEIALNLIPEDAVGEDQGVDVLFWSAETCEKLGDDPKAQGYYRKLIQVQPKHPKAWVSFERIAYILRRQGDLGTALLYLQNIDNVYPQYAEIARVRQAIAEIKTEIQQSSDQGGTPSVGPILSDGQTSETQ